MQDVQNVFITLCDSWWNVEAGQRKCQSLACKWFSPLLSNIIANILFFHPALSGGTSCCRSPGAVFLPSELHSPLPEDLKKVV